MRKAILNYLFLISYLYLNLAVAQGKANLKKTLPAVAASGADSAQLPVKRVVLYKNGVGYFEHSARVHGNQDLTIDFTTAQLDDVLKSLTAVDLGEGRVTSVRYNSVAPLDQRLKSLRLPFGAQVTREDFLAALRGSRVQVRSGSASIDGRLLNVEKERKSNGKGDFYDVTEFSVVTDNGELRNFELAPAISIRVADHDLNDEIGRYLSLIGSSRARDLRRMTISATGAGDRDIFVSYISEVPVWKSTYRIILPGNPNEKPLLQGWAIVDNTIGEDWKDVQLALIAGAPQSFVESLSQPYYVRRPTVQLPPSVMLTPQAHEGTLEGSQGNAGAVSGGAAGITTRGGPESFVFSALAGGLQGTVTDPSGAAVPGARVTVRNEETGTSQTTITDAKGVYRLYNVSSGNAALFVSASGFQRFELTNFFLGVGRMNEIDARLQIGSTNEAVEVQAEAMPVETAESSLAEVASKQHVEAEGKDLGDYFEYKVKQKITIGKNQSALVPIVQAHIDAEKISLWNEESKEIRRALWLTNTSGLTLDAGTFNIVEADNFAGEGLLETIHPAERRLISYAADPALRITMDTDSSKKPVTRVRIAKGIMIATAEDYESRTYTIHNSDDSPRNVVIEHPTREGWELTNGAKPEETTPSFQRFRLAVKPDATEKLQIEEIHPDDTRYELADLGDEAVHQLTGFLADGRITPELRTALRTVLDKKNQISGLDSEIKARTNEVDTISKDQARVRENMKALKGSPEEKSLLLRYTRQLDSQEDRISALRQQISDFQSKADSAGQELQRMVQAIVLDDTF